MVQFDVLWHDLVQADVIWHDLVQLGMLVCQDSSLTAVADGQAQHVTLLSWGVFFTTEAKLDALCKVCATHSMIQECH